MDCIGPFERFCPVQPLAELQLEEPSDGVSGLREWTLLNRNGRVELGSVSWDSSWSPTGDYPAECGDGHRAGKARCTCGFHISLPKTSVARELENQMLSGSPLRIVGAARGWGQVTVETTVFRAEYARVAAIFVNSNQDEIYRSLAAQVAERYGSELVEVTSAEEVLDWLGRQDGVLDPNELERLFANQPIRMRPLGSFDLPWINDSICPEGFWPEVVALPRSSNAVQVPVSPNSLAVYPVVGMVHHDGREPLHADRFRPGSLVELIPEPDNPHDRNAIAVYDRMAEVQLGYLPRNIARDITGTQVEATRAYLLCTWTKASRDTRPFSAHVLVVPDQIADRISFDPDRIT